jgi:hypothetical protein
MGFWKAGKGLERDGAIQETSEIDSPETPSEFDPKNGFYPETERRLLALVNAHPKGKHFRESPPCSGPWIDAIVAAIINRKGVQLTISGADPRVAQKSVKRTHL